MGQSETIMLVKRNVLGEETYRYSGRLLELLPNAVILEAHFDRQDTNVSGLLLKRGDRFVETWYTDRWYNIFEVHAGDDNHVRGWYCNIGMPAEYSPAENSAGEVSYVDLGLDLVVFTDGRQIVLDEDEFEALDLSAETRAKAWQALEELQSRFARQLS